MSHESPHGSYVASARAMLLVVLLAARAAAEWVQIAQQHYRKPLRTHAGLATPFKPADAEATTPWGYNNHSVAAFNIGNEKRGETSHMVDDFDRYTFVDVEKQGQGTNFGRKPSPTETNEDESANGTVERIPNLGNVKRVILSNSPVKSPVIKLKPKNAYSDEGEKTEAENIHEIKPIHRKVHTNVKFYKTTPRNPFLASDEYDNVEFTEKVPVIKKKDSRYQDEHYSLKHSPKSEIIAATTTFMAHKDSKIINKVTTLEKTQKHKILINNDDEFYNNAVTESSAELSDPNKTAGSKNMDIKNPEHYQSTKVKTLTPQDSPVNRENFNTHVKHLDIQETIDTAPNGKLATKGTHKDKKGNAMETLMNFLKVVADTMSKNSLRSFNGKIRYLQELKATILANIEDRIDVAWADDDTAAGPRRRSRAARALGVARGHVEFPSSESALMTISFLTFAVFLIKLVLQVIQTYKNKSMMVAPLVVAAARARPRTVRPL